MQIYNDNEGGSIVLFNAPTKDEAKKLRRILLEKKLIRGGFIVPIEPGYLTKEGDIEEKDDFLLYLHTH